MDFLKLAQILKDRNNYKLHIRDIVKELKDYHDWFEHQSNLKSEVNYSRYRRGWLLKCEAINNERALFRDNTRSR